MLVIIKEHNKILGLVKVLITIQLIFIRFLFPSYDNTYIQGKVELEFMQHFSDIDINLIQLNVEQAIELYCTNKSIDFENIISKMDECNKSTSGNK